MKRWRENCNVWPGRGQMVAKTLSSLFPLSLCSSMQPKANTWATGAAPPVGRSIPQSQTHQSYFWPAATQRRSAALTALTVGWGAGRQEPQVYQICQMGDDGGEGRQGWNSNWLKLWISQPASVGRRFAITCTTFVIQRQSHLHTEARGAHLTFSLPGQSVMPARCPHFGAKPHALTYVPPQPQQFKD